MVMENLGRPRQPSFRYSQVLNARAELCFQGLRESGKEESNKVESERGRETKNTGRKEGKKLVIRRKRIANKR